MHRFWLLTVIFLFKNACVIKAQQLTKYQSAGWGYNYGSYLGTTVRSNFMRDSYTSGFQAFYEQRFQSQNNRLVHQNGALGVLLFHANTGSREYVGHVTAAATYIKLTVAAAKRFQSVFRLAGGISYVQKPFEANRNPKNIYIGSHLNVFSNFEWHNYWWLTKKYALYGGLSFTHFSNGAIKLPNKGMNIPTLTAGMLYNLHQSSVSKEVQTTTEKDRSFYLWATATVRQAPHPGGAYYFIPSAAIEYNAPSNNAHHWQGGIVFWYDASRNLKQIINNEPLFDKGAFQSGIYAGYELCFNRISIPLQLGIYTLNRNDESVLFQQLGVRYRMNRNLKVQLLMKTHANVAELLSAGIGYNFKK